MSADHEKSLADFDDIGFDGPVAGGYKSSLVSRCEALYTKPLSQYCPGDLRVMIGQDIGLQYLVPVALDTLSREPLVTGDYYPGDLLAAVIGCGKSRPYLGFWDKNPLLLSRLQEIVNTLRIVPEDIGELVQEFKARNVSMAGDPNNPPRKRRKRRRRSRGR